jgi:hypothetical protein
MRIFAYLTEIFIAVFGISRPRPEQERMANLLIGGFVLGLIAVACGMIGFTVYTLSSR